MSDGVEAIAKGLTEAQRQMFLRYLGCWDGNYRLSAGLRWMVQEGFLHPTTFLDPGEPSEGVRPTSLGLAVRSHLSPPDTDGSG